MDGWGGHQENVLRERGQRGVGMVGYFLNIESKSTLI